MKTIRPAATRINITIAYEDFAAGKRAERLFDRIAAIIGGGMKFGRQMWKFDVLGIPALLRMATEDAAGADLIVISSTYPAEPPAEVREWINQWVARQMHRRSALVSLTEIGSGDPGVLPASGAYCKRIARKAGMAFLCDRDPRSSGNALYSYDGDDLQAESLCSLMAQIGGREVAARQ